MSRVLSSRRPPAGRIAAGPAADQERDWMTVDGAWAHLSADAAHASQPIDAVTGNDKIVNREASAVCNPQLP